MKRQMNISFCHLMLKIFADKLSGKDTNREAFQETMNLIQLKANVNIYLKHRNKVFRLLKQKENIKVENPSIEKMTLDFSWLLNCF
ncbi:resolvase [Enterococcus sp. DIV0213j]|jgi:hypothetical protein